MIKLRLGPMLGMKRFRCATIAITGIELIHWIRKGQVELARTWDWSRFYGCRFDADEVARSLNSHKAKGNNKALTKYDLHGSAQAGNQKRAGSIK